MPMQPIPQSPGPLAPHSRHVPLRGGWRLDVQAAEALPVDPCGVGNYMASHYITAGGETVDVWAFVHPHPRPR